MSLFAYEGDFESFKVAFSYPLGTFDETFGYSGYMKMTSSRYENRLESFSSYLGYTRVPFQKTFIFRMNLNDFTYLLAHLDTTWGAFWGDFGRALVQLWGDFGHIAVEWQV